MIAAHRHNFDRAPRDWTSAMNLFSLMSALLLALAIIVLLLLCFDLMQRQAPPAQAEPAQAAALQVRTMR
jgi:flagellar biogenesis protein FliO